MKLNSTETKDQEMFKKWSKLLKTCWRLEGLGETGQDVQATCNCELLFYDHMWAFTLPQRNETQGFQWLYFQGMGPWFFQNTPLLYCKNGRSLEEIYISEEQNKFL